jgi:hypothetical protein
MDVRLPDGTIINNVPEGTTQAELTAKLSSKGYNLSTDNAPDQPKIEQPKSYSTMGAIGTGAINLIPSTGRLLKGAYQAVRHPIDTANTLADLGAGEIYKALPQSFQEQLDKSDVALVGQNKAQETKTRALNLANALNQDYSKKYGSYEGFKTAFAEDPASILADVSTLLTGGGGALKASNLTKAADVVNQAAKYTNPLYLGTKAVQGAAYIPSHLTKGTLGVTTGVGKAPIEEAIKAGEANVLKGTTTFAENMRNPQRSDAVEIARQALDNIRQSKNQQYRGGMVDISKDKSILNFDDIDLARLNTEGIGTYKGKVVNERAADAMNQVKSAINEWKSADPAEFHTPEGMDKLKQKVGGILESIPYEQGTARTAVQNIYNSVKGTISKQAPTYAKVMQDYGEASDLIKEIEKSLSLGKKASADTAMRKLQSIMRNNVTSNYGQRAGAAEELINAGASELKPALAGQSMSAVLPRGLGGQLETYGGGFAALSNPSILMAAPFASPRAMGELLYKYGQTKGLTKKALNKIPLGVDQANKIGTLLYQMNQNKEQQ